MELQHNWRNKSIETLEGYSYGDPATAPTGLIKRCLEYVKMPVSDLSVGQLSTLIKQRIGLIYTVPLALEYLKNNISAGNLFEGELLEGVLNVDPSFWQNHSEIKKEIQALINKYRINVKRCGIKFEDFIKK